MKTLSVSLITKNEEANLPRWLRAVSRFADEVVAVDCGSSDATVGLLEAAGAKVAQREWSGFADQKNHAANLCTGNLILNLDADEVPDPELCRALVELKGRAGDDSPVMAINRKPYFFGKFLTHGGFFPEYRPRLHRPGQARWEGQVHERLEFSGKADRLPGFVRHYTYPTVSDYLTRLEGYSSQAAQVMAQKGRKAGAVSVWSHSAWAFVSRYLLRLGFLDGYQGYLAARLESVYTMAKYAKLIELNRREEKP